jgi:fucose 4-O-acetylase-like acetyltransferase
METFNDWWQGLSLILKIFWSLAVPFTLFFLLQLVLSFLGGDPADSTPDIDVESDHGISFQFLTLKNMVGFFTIFSWTGIACIDAGFSNTTTLIVSTLAGLCMMALMAGMFYFISKANADGTMKMEKAIGVVGEVYLTIPSGQSGLGKVQIKVMGSLRTLDAMTDLDRDIPTGKLVTVSKIINDNILLVTEN